jgi:flagellar hook-associated protein 3 FlgL
MRIATAHAFDSAIDQLSQRQSQLDEAQLRLTSGKRVMRASDDPVNAARAERALAAVSRAATSQRSLEASRSAMTQLESALGDAGDLLQTAREAIVAGGNASYDSTQRQMLAGQIRSLRDQLLSVANRGDGAGGYLFGGQGSSAPPFLDAAGGVQYVGTRGANSADPATEMPMTMDGAAAWMSASTGNGVFETQSVTSNGSAWIDTGSVTNPAAITGSSYQVQFSVAAGVTTYSVLKGGVATAMTNVAFVPGQAIQFDGMSFTISGQPAHGDEFDIVPSHPTLSVFDALDKAANDLASPTQTGGAIAQATSANLRNLDSVLTRMLGSRATAGEALNRIDSIGTRLDSASLNGQTERSKAEDLDMATAISDFQSKQTGYSAALKTYASVQRMSLFDYIKT